MAIFPALVMPRKLAQIVPANFGGDSRFGTTPAITFQKR